MTLFKGGNLYVTGTVTGSNLSGTNTGDQTITLTGDVTGTGTGTFTTTLANSGVTANTYGSSTLIPSITVDAKGRITSANTTSIIANAGTLTGTSLASTVTGSSLTVSTGSITGGNIINANGNGVGNIGSSALYFNTVFAKATSAQYADLAEKYLADKAYDAGTVVCIGGAAEVTAAQSGSMAIGVVSANPAYMMNSALVGGTYIALKGRVPVKIIGSVRKGDALVPAGNGSAKTDDSTVPGQHRQFGIALEDNVEPGIKLVECVIL